MPFPLGSNINGSPHSVCVSLPTLRDVIGYEEKEERVLQAMQNGYPRFFEHEWIRTLRESLQAQGRLHGMHFYPTASAQAAEDLRDFAESGMVREIDGFHGVAISLEESRALRKGQLFLQHTGCALSSRQAEDALIARQKLASPFAEITAPEEADLRVREKLAQVYGSVDADDIFLCRGGMNALYAGFRTLREVQARRGRHLWVQLGWLYVDTIRVVSKFAHPEFPSAYFPNVTDLDTLEGFLAAHHREIAGIVTETPTNPLVHTTDVARLRSMADRYEAALILDPTIVSPHNVNILPYSDAHINSLTKYAANEGDVMLGALALNPLSKFYAEARELAPQMREAPYPRDLARLAHEIQGYDDYVATANANTDALVDFLDKHPRVKQVHWAFSAGCGGNYRRLRHRSGGPGCVFTIDLDMSMERFYDRLDVVKSPSFGTRYSMACPFMYLAHYDLVSTHEGRLQLLRNGLNPDLVRISSGTEPIDDLIARFSEALA